jgi:hypothetical protein
MTKTAKLATVTRQPTSAHPGLKTRRLFASFLVAFAFVAVSMTSGGTSAQTDVTRQQVLDAMQRATTFMTEKVSTRGGYVWSYLPDLSRRWGEMEARPSMVWIQPPGTPSMGHLFLDAYHTTGDELYYRAAEKAAAALMAAQHESGGWNYVFDMAGEQSLRDWYNTVGRNGWRLEEFQHYWGNATFDDAGTAEAAKFFLRSRRRSPSYSAANTRTARGRSVIRSHTACCVRAIPTTRRITRSTTMSRRRTSISL